MNWKALAARLGIKLAADATDTDARGLVLDHLSLPETASDEQVKASADKLLAPSRRPFARKPGTVLGRGKWWQVKAAGDDAVDLLVYGDIGESWFGDSVTAKALVEQLQGITAGTITVRINSYGGSVSDGIAIYNALRAHKAEVTTEIEGVAFSIASLIAMAGDTVRMGNGTLMMIHAPWGAAQGNAVEMRRYADVLDRFAAAMVSAYASKAGADREGEIRTLLTDGQDHYFDPAEAQAFGLVDELTPQLAAAASFDLSRYPHLPAAAAAFASSPQQQQESDMNFKAIAAALGLKLAANASEAQIKAAVLKALGLADTADDTAVQAALDQRNTPAPAPAGETAEQVQARITARNKSITAVFAKFRDRPGVADLEREVLGDASLTVEAANNRLLAHLGNGAEPLGAVPRTEMGADGRDRMVAGAAQAMSARLGIEKRDPANEFNGMSLDRLAERCLANSGINVRGMSRDGIARKVLASQTSSDFPLLLSSVASKALRKSYEEHPGSYGLWCAIGEVSDFKASPRIQLGSFNNLDTKVEGGEYTYGSIAEEAESITAATKGKGLKLTREMIVNDDLGAFVRRAQMLGRAAARTVNADVYSLLTSGAGNDGPTMSDTGQLFNTTAVTTAGGHANKAGAGGAVSVTTVSAGRAAMRKQRAKGKDLANPGAVLNIQPRYLIAPVGLEDVIWAVLNSTSDPSSSNSAKRNYVRDVAQLVLVTDPLLDAVSATAWWLAADPMDAPLIEVDFLDGNRTPFIDEAVDFDTDAMKLKVRLDYGLSAIDWRAGYKNPGA